MKTNHTIHCIAGLPRSGSTLLAGLLRQNPRFHARMSSPVETIYAATVRSMSGENYFSHFISETQRERILRNIFSSYYEDMTQEVLFDTNRDWPAWLPSLTRLYPNVKMICCVRSIVAIANDFEHLTRRNPLEVSKLYDFDPKATVYGRVERLMSAKGPIGRAFNAFREGYYGLDSDRLLVVEYKELASSPQMVLERIYKHIGEPFFNHDVERVMYDEVLFDASIGLPTMHTVEPRVQYRPKQLILPADMVEKYKNLEFWRRPKKNVLSIFESIEDL